MPPADWTVTRITDAERPLLDRLVQLYLYDFSEIDHDDVGEDGRYAYDEHEQFGRQPGHDAWLLRVGGKAAGFALIDATSPLEDGGDRHYVHDFHVLRAYRRRGYGEAMAWALFDRYPGGWQVEQIGPNRDAQCFWRRVIDRYTGGRYTERTRPGRRFHLVLQEFDTADRALP